MIILHREIVLTMKQISLRARIIDSRQEYCVMKNNTGGNKNMFKKTAIFAAAVMALTMFATGCGAGAKSSIAMDMADEKKAAIEFSNAKEDDFVQGGYIRVDEGEGVEVKSSLNDDGKILIGFIAVEEDQSIDKLPDRDNTKYEMMISGKATQGATLDPGDYDLRITVQSKASGNVTLNVKPVNGIAGMEGVNDSADTDISVAEEAAEGADTSVTEEAAEGGHTNWTQASTAREACEGAGLDSLADLNGTKITLGVLGEMGDITYRYMDGVVQTFCPAAAVEMSFIKGKIPSGTDGDVSLDNTPYKYEWTQDVDGQEVKCFGNRDGEATKTIWSAGDYNYAVVAYGAGGDDDFGLCAEDVATMVNAVK